MNEIRSGLVRVEWHPDTPMIVTVLENGRPAPR